MMLLQQDLELVEGEAATRSASAQPGRSSITLPPPIGVGARIGRVGQEQVDGLIGRLDPDQLALIGSPMQPPREPQAVLSAEPEHSFGRSQPLELGQHRLDRRSDLLIRIELHLAVPITDIADWQFQPEFSAARLAESGPLEPRLQTMQFHFTDGPA